MTEPAADHPSQALRDQMAAAIEGEDLDAVRRLLAAAPELANADLRVSADRDQFTNGRPLYRAAVKGLGRFVDVLLAGGAHPDAPGPDPDDQPEMGLPLHVTAAERRDYPLAHRLLDAGADPNSYPNCDKSTIERVFYHAHDAGLSDRLVRRTFARYLPDRAELEAHPLAELAGRDAAAPVALYARMVDLRAQTPLRVLVREGYDDLVMEIVEHSRHDPGPRHDHPNASVIDGFLGAAHWYGYPVLVRRLMEQPSHRYRYEDALGSIGVAIGSHNRDGGYPEYREIIVMHLDALAAHGDLERAQRDPEFKPLYQIATEFTWRSNYGYRAAIAAPECYADLAELFVAHGLDDHEHRDPENGHSPLSAAVARGDHPGIRCYIEWLLDRGADLRLADPDEVNPIAIARAKGHEAILRRLESRASG